MYKLLIGITLLFSSVIANAATVDIVDAEYQGYNYNTNVDYFSPVGQSFTAGANQLDFINLLLLDMGPGTENLQSNVIVRDGDINGAIIGQSQTVVLEDCFNFTEAPGCGISGGTATAVRFDFSSLSLFSGNLYTFEIIDLGTGLGFGYDLNGGYEEGTAYFNGAASTSDLWFSAGHISAVPVPAALWLFISGLLGLTGFRLSTRT